MRWNPEQRAVALAGAATIVLFAVVAANSVSWIGRTFPGFMVMANGVVPSIALPNWSDGRAPETFQSQVLEMDGTPVRSSEQIYARVAAAPTDEPVLYSLKRPSGQTWQFSAPPEVFTGWDYAYLFGAYLLNGFVFCFIGLLVVWLKPRQPASQGVGVAVFSTGLFVTTAADLYGPHWFFRLHVAAELWMAAGFCHLALVFPTDRLGARRPVVLRWLYGITVALVGVYEAVLWTPAWYTFAHLGAVAAQVVSCFGMIAAFVYDYARSGSPLVRKRIQIVTVGVVAGMLAPAATWAVSAVLGGHFSMNWAALTAFLFPLSFAYAVLQQDLFEIDVVIRRAVTYTATVVATVTVYVAVLGGASWLLDARGGIAEYPTVLVVLNVAMLLLLSPLRARTQLFIDGIFLRRQYEPQRMVARLGGALESALRIEEVVDNTRAVLNDMLWPQELVLFDCRSGELTPLRGQDGGRAAELTPELRTRLAEGKVLTRYEWDERSRQSLPALWAETGFEIAVPIVREGQLDGVLALGRKGSGRSYNAQDSSVLRTMAGQISLALATARAFGDLEDLNHGLEEQVELRTAELGEANAGLRESLARLNVAYEQLEQNQTSLVRADRLATLGRLAAGIAHEVNTPLAAVLNSLELLKGLGAEYRDSVDDTEVTPSDHLEIAGEILQRIDDAQTWAERAASYIGRVKSHGREPGQEEVRPFELGDVISEIEGLLSHRLRALGCRVDADPETRAVSLRGDPARLSHVLMNVVDNAIGAYEEQDDPDGRIEIRAIRTGDTVSLTIRDYAGGIPPSVAERVFDELFTTKERGKGTGLGLWIARNVVEKSFRGTLELSPVQEPGTCLLATLVDEARAEPEAQAAGEDASVPRP